jgi:hypothetical protein
MSGNTTSPGLHAMPSSPRRGTACCQFRFLFSVCSGAQRFEALEAELIWKSCRCSSIPIRLLKPFSVLFHAGIFSQKRPVYILTTIQLLGLFLRKATSKIAIIFFVEGLFSITS